MRDLASVGLLFVLGLFGCQRQPEVSFSQDVQPILKRYCHACHLNGGEGHVASGLLVESHDTLMRGTKFAPVITPGQPVSSRLYLLMAGEVDPSLRMPHGRDPISAREIATIGAWIAQGAANN